MQIWLAEQPQTCHHERPLSHQTMHNESQIMLAGADFGKLDCCSCRLPELKHARLVILLLSENASLDEHLWME